MPPPAIAEVVDVWRGADARAGRAPGGSPGAMLREQGRSRRRLESAPARPDLRDELHLQDDRRPSCGAAERHQRETGRGLMADIIRAEQQDGRRVLHEDEHAIAFVPYFARYAYEVYVAPKRRVAHVFDADRRRGGVAGGRALRRDRPLRQPVAACRSRTCRCCTRRRPTAATYRGVSFLHRVPSAAAPAPPAEVPGRPGDRRRQLRVRHLARGQGRRAARAGAAALQARHDATLRDVEALVVQIRRVHEAIRDEVVAACERQAIDELSAVVGDDAGDTIYAVDRVSEAVLLERFEELVAAVALPARGRGARDGRAPRAARRHARRGRRDRRSSSIRSTARAA